MKVVVVEDVPAASGGGPGTGVMLPHQENHEDQPAPRTGDSACTVPLATLEARTESESVRLGGLNSSQRNVFKIKLIKFIPPE